MRLFPVFSGGHVKSFGAGLYGLVDEALRCGHEVYLPTPSWEGLIANDHLQVTDENKDRLITADGPFIPSQISRRKLTGADLDRIVSLYDNPDNVIVVYGGDDSRANALSLMQRGIKTMAWAKTMDNDTDASLLDFGFVDFVTEAAQAVLDAKYQAHGYGGFMVIGTFARDMDHVPAAVAHYGLADMMIGGETRKGKIISKDLIVERVLEILEKNKALTGVPFGTAVVSEGAVNIEGYQEDIEVRAHSSKNLLSPFEVTYDSHGHPKLQPALVAMYISGLISRYVGCKTFDMAVTYQGRNGKPCAFEKKWGVEASREIVRAINDGDFGKCAALEYNPNSGNDTCFSTIRVPLEKSARKISLAELGRNHGLIPVNYEQLRVNEDLGKLYDPVFGKAPNRDTYIPKRPSLVSI